VGPRVFLLVGLSVLAGACGGGKQHQPPAEGARWFYSPGASCELGVNRPAAGTYATCQTTEPMRSVTLGKDGRVEVCRGAQCVGNAPENASPLRPEAVVRLGPFSCARRPRGIRCSAAPSGHGFLVGRHLLVRF